LASHAPLAWSGTCPARRIATSHAAPSQAPESPLTNRIVRGDTMSSCRAHGVHCSTRGQTGMLHMCGSPPCACIGTATAAESPSMPAALDRGYPAPGFTFWTGFCGCACRGACVASALRSPRVLASKVEAPHDNCRWSQRFRGWRGSILGAI